MAIRQTKAVLVTPANNSRQGLLEPLTRGLKSGCPRVAAARQQHRLHEDAVMEVFRSLARAYVRELRMRAPSDTSQ